MWSASLKPVNERLTERVKTVSQISLLLHVAAIQAARALLFPAIGMEASTAKTLGVVFYARTQFRRPPLNRSARMHSSSVER